MRRFGVRALPCITTLGGIACFGALAVEMSRIWPASRSTANVCVKQELLWLGLQQDVIDYLRTHDPALIQTHEDLVRYLNEAGFDGRWMVTMGRSHMKQGNPIDIPVVTMIGRHSHEFELTQAYLLTAIGRPPREYFSGAQVIIIPPDLAAKDPWVVLPEILASGAKVGRRE